MSMSPAMGRTTASTARLREQFAAAGIIVLDDIFGPELAQRLQAQGRELDDLRAKVADPEQYWPWMARFSLGTQSGRVRGRESRVPERLRDAIAKNASADPHGQQGLYYLFSYLMSCRVEAPADCPEDAVACRGRPSPDCALCGIAERLASEVVRESFRELTGLALLGSELSLSFTRYDRDSFISPHNDVSSDPGYELTFLYYVNDPWDDSWGGDLHFQRGTEPPRRIAPRGNRLVLFAPTQDARHWVAPVSPAAPRSRYAVAGWYLQ